MANNQPSLIETNYLRFTTLLKTEPWQVRYLFDLGFQGWMVHVGVVLLTAWMVAAALPNAKWPYLWLATILALSLALGLLCRTHSSAKRQHGKSLIGAGYVHTGLAGIVGLVWAVGALGATTGTFNLRAVYLLALFPVRAVFFQTVGKPAATIGSLYRVTGAGYLLQAFHVVAGRTHHQWDAGERPFPPRPIEQQQVGLGPQQGADH